MSREIGMYSDSRPICKNDPVELGEERNVLLPVLMAIFFPVVFFGVIAIPFFIFSNDNEDQDESVVVNQRSTVDDSSERRNVASHGNTSTVSLDIILTPYVWNFYLKDIMTSDSVHVNLGLSLTSRVRKGGELLLVKNYGANWLYTSFIYHYKDQVKRAFSENIVYQELVNSPVDTRDHLFTRMATDLLKGMSDEFQLPVDILEVKVHSIDKIDR